MKAVRTGTVLALAMLMFTISPMASLSQATSQPLGANELAPEIAVSLNSTGIYFGTLTPGQVSDTFLVGVTNEGNAPVVVTCEVTDDGGAVFVPGLVIDGSSWSKFSTILSIQERESIHLSLEIPSGLPVGRYTGNITFWADVADDAVRGSVDWPTFQGDNHHSGVTSEQGPISSSTLQWSVFSSSSGMAGLDGAPIIAEGRLFVINNKGSVEAYDADDGSILWRRTDLVINSGLGFQLSTPVYNDGVLYAALLMGTGKGVGVFALNATNGATMWSIGELVGGYAQPNTPLVYDDGRVYLGYWLSASIPGKYSCLNAADGSIIWQRTCTAAASYNRAGAAVVGEYLIFGDEAGNLTTVNKATGTTMQEISVKDAFNVPGGKIRSSVSYSNASGMAFFTIQSGYCCALGFDVGSGSFDTTKMWVTSIGFSTSTPAVHNGKVYVGTGEYAAAQGANLICLDEGDGSVLWNFTADGGVQSSPVISTHYDDGDGEVYVYFTTNLLAGSVYCLDDEGNQMWKYSPPEEKQQYILQGVAIYNGMIYFGNDAGYLFALGGG
jgi:outer membrane protein assembly factor BamB